MGVGVLFRCLGAFGWVEFVVCGCLFEGVCSRWWLFDSSRR